MFLRALIATSKIAVTLDNCSKKRYNMSQGECAGSVQVIQQGGSPCPTKRSEQSVLSLGAQSREVRFKRRRRSVRAAMGNREAIQPRKIYRMEAEVILHTAGRNNRPIKRGREESVGVNRAWRAHKGNTCIPGRSVNLR